jgi:tetratricopeptide (TPR) repeat protein
VLDGLTRRDLARGRDTSAFEGTREFVFKHHLLHKVTYDSVLKRDRREQHRLTAEWLVKRSGERASEYHGLIADHFEKAGDRANAIAYLRKAGVDARKAYAVEVALGYFDRALALMPDSAEKFDVMLTRLATAFDRRASEMQERNLIALEQLAEVLDDDFRRAQAASFRVTYQAWLPDLAATSAAAVRALGYARASGNTAAQMRSHNQWGHALTLAGEFAAAQEQLEQGLALARSAGNRSGESSALEKLGRIAQARGRYGEARRYLQGALELARQLADGGWAHWLRCALAENELSIGHREQANAQLLEVLKAYRAIGWPECEAYVALCMARSAYARAEFAEGMGWLDQAVEADPGNEELDLEHYFLRANLHAALGQETQAASCYERSAAACRKLNRPLAALEMQAGLARLSLSGGDLPQARARIGDVVAQLDAGWRPEESVMDDLRLLLTCHEVLAAAGDERAGAFCAMAHERMQARAEMLEPGDRDAFLGNVATNRAVAEAWRSCSLRT